MRVNTTKERYCGGSTEHVSHFIVPFRYHLCDDINVDEFKMRTIADPVSAKIVYICTYTGHLGAYMFTTTHTWRSGTKSMKLLLVRSNNACLDACMRFYQS